MLKPVGEELWKKAEKINSELFSLMYGGLVYQVLKDYEDCERANLCLKGIGARMGTRLMEDFISRSWINLRNSTLKELHDVVLKDLFRAYFNVAATVATVNQEGTEYLVTINENILAEFVEIPEEYIKKGFAYSSILAGLVEGMMESIQIKVACAVEKCPTTSSTPSTELKVSFIKHIEDEIPPSDI